MGKETEDGSEVDKSIKARICWSLRAIVLRSKMEVKIQTEVGLVISRRWTVSWKLPGIRDPGA